MRTYGEPVDRVRVGGVASATGILLITGAVDNDGVLEGSYTRIIDQPRFPKPNARLDR